MTEYKLEYSPPNPGWRKQWIIRNLPERQEIYDLEDNVEDHKDTVLYLVGMKSVMDTWQEVVNEVHRVLYDEYQMNENIEEGDTFVSKETNYLRFEWDPLSMMYIPAMKFIAKGMHILPERNGDKRFELLMFKEK